ncbi:mitochondrial 2-oxoglutarate/malate carrier protein-like isoform X1 [Halichondria panicea]|uniref:mitochondrial 2-oxoglutarate/malate carrier protein-like isoform X1 n=1 Tax=Halichondria panicea TaxID=6063 RepID=UPI00312B32A2
MSGAMAVKENSAPSKVNSGGSIPPGSLPRSVNFLLGGTAGCGAVFVTQPLDLIKNRMQLSGEGGANRVHKTSFHALVRIVRTEGFFALYNGLSAGLFRQATYSTTRLGVYQSLFDRFSSSDGRPPGVLTKIAFGMIAGATGALIGTPAEISLIRMTSDGRLPPSEQRGYKNVFDALARISREEGLGTLWRGCGPTVLRAMVVNAAQLATYSQAKQFLLTTSYFVDDIKCHFGSSMISGLVTTLVSMPVDIAKTRIQTMKTVDGVPEYNGSMDVWKQLVRKEGIFSLWKGFTPYYARLGPHTVLTFIFLEQFRRLYYDYYVRNK